MKKVLCKLYPDFHIPGETAGVGGNFDGMSYCASLKAHSVESIVMLGKCHYGLSYYPTEIGTVHPGLVKIWWMKPLKARKLTEWNL